MDVKFSLIKELGVFLKVNQNLTEKIGPTEYLSSKISVKSVNSLNETILHINKYGTMHTDNNFEKQLYR